ncbi:MAG: hypothetical protein LBF28_02865 [Rickettsiales bacterium]|nr:hypothetical protein [Rickettsiales bacterium]
MKKHFKLFIGISAIILFAVVFFFLSKSGELETGSMTRWKSAPVERRAAAVKILTGTDDGADLMVRCLDKIADLPESADMPVKDAASLCFMGIQLKDSI